LAGNKYSRSPTALNTSGRQSFTYSERW
jgi:hypothetical protein